MQATIQYIKSELSKLYPETEIQGFVRIIFELVLNFSYTDILLQKEKTLEVADIATIKAIVQRLKTYEPIQYILSETEFYDLKFKVNRETLIPRPETEELVHWIINSSIKSGAQILDIGTGSACIPVALKNELGNAKVTGVDISEGALAIAKENAALNNLDVDFFQVDILNWQNYDWQNYDVIVSNPPYVRESEKKQMETNVLEYEPDGALFVDDNNPLIFYKTIAEFAQTKLKENGYLFFEINEYLGNEMIELVKCLGFREIKLRKDLNNKDRMLRCKK